MEKYPASLYLRASQEAYQKTAERNKFIGYGFVYDEAFSNDEVAVYANDAKQIVIVSYRGTDFTNLGDLIADLGIALKNFNNSLRWKNIVRFFVNNIWRKYNKYTMILTGHSLGGHSAEQMYHIAEKSSSNDKDDKISYHVFNRGTTWIESKTEGVKQNDRVHQHIQNDALSKAFLKNNTVNHFIYPATGNLLKNHLLNSFQRYRLQNIKGSGLYF